MTIAWFRAADPDAASPFDDITTAIAELRTTHEVTVFTATTAHDFVWQHFRAPFDLCVHEVDASAAHTFVWPYALHYGGVLVLRTPSMPTGRGRPLRAALLAARLVVVPYGAAAAPLEDAYPGIRVRVVPKSTVAARGADLRGPTREPDGLAPRRHTRFAMAANGRREVAARALARARAAGARADLIAAPAPGEILCDADVVLALEWPSFTDAEPLALAGMAAGQAVVVFETEATADWPALDPQTWRPRGPTSEPPIAVSIDPRDEEHSLMLVMQRLAADAALRARLGAAAHAWWRTHASVPGSVARWQRVLEEAVTVPAPVHAAADGTGRAREILDEIGVRVDLF